MFLNPLYRYPKVSIIRGLKLGSARRTFITRSLLLQQAKNDDANKESDSKKKEIQPINPRNLGVASDVYIPVSYKNLPNPLYHPKLFLNSILRRVYTLGLNTLQITIFRHQTGFKPKFLIWKNSAIDLYIRVNTAFAKGDVLSLKSNVSIWVETALKKRSKQFPKSTELTWKLTKFNKVPKLVSIQSIMLPNQPLEFVQLIYKFDTKQALIRLDKASKKTDKIERDVVDYIAFLCDSPRNKLYLIGSVFEKKPTDKIPKTFENDTKLTFARMRKYGDIYRVEDV